MQAAAVGTVLFKYWVLWDQYTTVFIFILYFVVFKNILIEKATTCELIYDLQVLWKVGICWPAKQMSAFQQLCSVDLAI
jgi:hypothetical protein